MIKYLEDHTVGEKTRQTAYRLSREEVIEFAGKYARPLEILDRTSADDQVDEISAGGFHIAAIMSRLQIEMAIASGAYAAMITGLGIDELRWLKPVYSGDVLEAECEVVDTVISRSKPDRGVLRCRQILYNQNGEAVMSMFSAVMMKRRPQQE
jgi:acyl dehydratase